MCAAPHVEMDMRLGGRLTSLTSADGFEWLWTNPRGSRHPVEPGSSFIDAGGVEECFPTIAGDPDHGALWSRPWTRIDSRTASCTTSEARLTRSIDQDEHGFVFSYLVEADPGYRFVWAFHALITPARDLHLSVTDGESVASWPDGYHRDPARSEWPRVGAIRRFDDMRVDDATATFALLDRRTDVTVTVGARSLAMSLDAPDCPAAIGIWRNLSGFSGDGGAPYRSIGIEPMLGLNPMLDSGQGTAVIPDSGELRWRLTLATS